MKQSLKEVVKAGIASRRPQLSWIDRLTVEHRKEVEEIKRAWLAGELQCSAKAMSEILFASCAERGIKTCGTGGLRSWLAKR